MDLGRRFSFDIFPDQSDYSVSNIAQVSNGMKHVTTK